MCDKIFYSSMHLCTCNVLAKPLSDSSYILQQYRSDQAPGQWKRQCYDTTLYRYWRHRFCSFFFTNKKPGTDCDSELTNLHCKSKWFSFLLVLVLHSDDVIFTCFCSESEFGRTCFLLHLHLPITTILVVIYRTFQWIQNIVAAL